MNSIDELHTALESLAGYQSIGTAGAGTTSNGSLENTVKICRKLSTYFEGVNSDLQLGWTTSADVFEKIQTSISQEISGMVTSIRNYINSTRSEESSATKAMEEANVAAAGAFKALAEVSKSVDAVNASSGSVVSPSQPNSFDTPGVKNNNIQ